MLENITDSANLQENISYNQGCGAKLRGIFPILLLWRGQAENFGLGSTPTYTLLFDITKAFDTVALKQMFATLYNDYDNKTVRAVLRIIQNQYKRVRNILLSGQSFSKFYKLMRGILQGSVPAPLLYVLNTDELQSILKALHASFLADNAAHVMPPIERPTHWSYMDDLAPIHLL